MSDARAGRQPAPGPPRTVVLLHGLGRTSRSMEPMERAATARGYTPMMIAYPSRTASIPQLAERVAENVQRRLAGSPAHFVTHSLGGIIVRAAVAAGLIPLDAVSRVVMLAPPNQGSEIPDRFGRSRLLGEVYRRMTGPAGGELGVGADAVPNRLGPVPFDTGVIAGSRTINPVLSAIIPGPDDGKVAVARTGVAGMRDFLVVPHSHTFIMRSKDVIRQTFHFLEHGAFVRET